MEHLLDELAEDTHTARDATAAGIALLAYVINTDGELKRYYRWLTEMAVLQDDTGLPPFGEYCEHLETVLAYFLAHYCELDDLLDNAGQAVSTSARMSPAVASGPGRAPQPGKGGRHRTRGRS